MNHHQPQSDEHRPLIPPTMSGSGNRLPASLHRYPHLFHNFHDVCNDVRPHSEQPGTSLSQNVQSGNVVINLEEPSSSTTTTWETPNSTASPNHHMHSLMTQNFLNNLREATASLEQAVSNNNTDEAAVSEALRQLPEARAFFDFVQKYVPFVLILLAKCLYDHREGILNFVVLFIMFCHANSVVKREAAKQGRRSLTALGVEVVYIVGCIMFIDYVFQEEKLYLNLVFIPSYTQPLSLWQLLWIVGITDFMLKLITIVLKIIVTALPAALLPYQKRGKIYLFMEATSQLYRCLAPSHPWLYYLLESYQGPEKVVGVFLSAAYMVSKGQYLMSRLSLFKDASLKLLQNVNLGSSPNKEQIQSTGGQCPICHDDFNSPVLLQCRHIFCESCVSTWFDREQTCPLCRAKVVDDPAWRNGATTYFVQLF